MTNLDLLQDRLVVLLNERKQIVVGKKGPQTEERVKAQTRLCTLLIKQEQEAERHAFEIQKAELEEREWKAESKNSDYEDIESDLEGAENRIKYLEGILEAHEIDY